MSSICAYHQYKPRFNTAFTFPFFMNHWFEDDAQLLHGAQIRAAIQDNLDTMPDEDLEDFCLADPFDTMEEPVGRAVFFLIEEGDGIKVRGMAGKTHPTEEWPEGAPTSLPDELKE